MCSGMSEIQPAHLLIRWTNSWAAASPHTATSSSSSASQSSCTVDCTNQWGCGRSCYLNMTANVRTVSALCRSTEAPERLRGGLRACKEPTMRSGCTGSVVAPRTEINKNNPEPAIPGVIAGGGRVRVKGHGLG